MKTVHLLALLCLFALPFGELHPMKAGIHLSAPNILGLVFLPVAGYLLAFTPEFRKGLPVTPLILFALLAATVVGGNLHHLAPRGAIAASTTIVGCAAFFLAGIVACSNFSSYRWDSFLLAGALLPPIVALGHTAGLIPYFEPFNTWNDPRTYGSLGLLKFGAIGLMKSRGSYGILCLSGLTVASLWALNGSRNRRIAGRCAAYIIIGGIIVSASRSTWLASLVYFFTLATLFATTPIKTSKPSITIWASAALFIIATFIMHNAIIDIARTIYNISPDTVRFRIESYQVALEAIKNNPLTGLGPKFEHNTLHLKHITHNTFLRIGATYGLPALAALTFIIVHTYIKLAKEILNPSSQTGKLESIILCSALTAAMVETNLFSGEYSKPLWTLLGIISAKTSTQAKAQ